MDVIDGAMLGNEDGVAVLDGDVLGNTDGNMLGDEDGMNVIDGIVLGEKDGMTDIDGVTLGGDTEVGFDISIIVKRRSSTSTFVSLPTKASRSSSLSYKMSIKFSALNNVPADLVVVCLIVARILRVSLD